MGSSIQCVDILKGDPKMPRELALEILSSDGLPETSPLDDIIPKECPWCKTHRGWGLTAFCGKCGKPILPEGPFPLKNRWGGISWGGCGASSHYLGHVLSRCEGDVDILIVWEGGGLEGMRVKDGKVSHPRVVITLENS